MTAQAMLAPIGAMAALTFIVLALIPFRRFRALARQEVRFEDFRYGESDAVPADVGLANRNYMNLLELPTLFYVVCLLFFVTGRSCTVAVTLAWGYVVLRAVHSVIHVSYNDVRHRLAAFALSNAVLIALWATFFIKLVSQ